MAFATFSPAALYLGMSIFCVALVYDLNIGVSSEMYEATVHRFVERPWRVEPTRNIYDVSGGSDVYQWLREVVVNELFKETCDPPYFSEVGASVPPPPSEKCGQDWKDDLALWHSFSDSVDEGTINRTRVGPVLTLGQYNRVLMARASLKRVKIVPYKNARFRNAYATTWASELEAASFSPDDEDRKTFGDTVKYEYEEAKGYKSAGGFVTYFNFDSDASTKDQLLARLEQLERNYWFDLHQGTFVIEVLMYNGNIGQFLYSNFVFEHSFSGTTNVQLGVHTLDLNWHHLSHGMTYVRFVLYFLMLVILVFFMKYEIEDITADGLSYFTSLHAWTNLSTLALALSCVGLYVSIVMSFTFLNFSFPLSDVPDERIEEFDSLTDLAESTSTFISLLAITTCAILTRTVMVASNLSPFASVMWKALYRMRHALAAFFITQCVVVSGFCISGYYLFGMSDRNYSTLLLAQVRAIRMVFFDRTLQVFEEADPILGSYYFIVFHLVQLFIQQLLYVIIMYGHDKEKEIFNSYSYDKKYPLTRFVQASLAELRARTSWLRRPAVALQQVLGLDSSSGEGKQNPLLVAQLRDRRATAPSRRVVIYEPREESEGEAEERSAPSPSAPIFVALTGEPQQGTAATAPPSPSRRSAPNGHGRAAGHHGHPAVRRAKSKDSSRKKKSGMPSVDLELRAVKPFYPGGMMQYYVDEVRSGPAEDMNLRKDFRLTGIELLGPSSKELLNFRKRGQFEKLGSTKALLEAIDDALPVSLEFEGPVKKLSRECFVIVWLIFSFLTLALIAGRVDDSYSQYIIHKNALFETAWKEEGSQGQKSFRSIDNLDSLYEWTHDVLLEQEFQCVTDIGSPNQCSVGNLYDINRTEWGLWKGVDFPYDSTFAALTAAPAAALGQSMAYVPLPQTAADVGRVVRKDAYNVGFMPNNHVRLTIQFACFEENSDERFVYGFPYVLNPKAKGSDGCAEDTCMRWQVEKSEAECLNSQGGPSARDGFRGQSSGVSYTYATVGTFRELGGVAIGLGNTHSEAAAVIGALRKDQAFRQNAVSFVFEFTTYNGNLDMFNYFQVNFGVQSSGKISKTVRTVQFALDFSRRPVVFSCAVIFFTLGCLLHVTFMCKGLCTQSQITQACGRPWYMTPADFFSEDPWNVVDFIWITLALALFLSWLQFITIGGNPNIFDGNSFETWTLKEFLFTRVAMLNTEDSFENFERAANIYQTQSGLAALTLLCLLVRLLKYFGGLPSFRVIMDTFASAAPDLLVAIWDICVIFCGFAICFHSIFGVQFPAFGEFPSAFEQLFLYRLGRFDIDIPIQQRPVLFAVLFIAYQGFFLILLGLLLAVIVHRWKEARKDAQELSLSATYRTVKDSFASRCFAEREEKAKLPQLRLNAEFWRELSIIHNLNKLDKDSGTIPSDLQSPGRGGHSSQSVFGSELAVRVDVLSPGSSAIVHFTPIPEHQPLGQPGGASDGPGWLDDVFRKAHMQMATDECQQVDRGAGVGLYESEDGRGSSSQRRHHEHHHHPRARPVDDAAMKETTLGIIEECYSERDMNAIRLHLGNKLAHDSQPLREVWIDSLVTVLEEAGGLHMLQKLFRPLPMVEPKKPSEWGQFQQNKQKMEERLNLFLGWLLAEADKKHFQFLKLMALEKERVLKQQNMVLANVLEGLDEEIEVLYTEIRGLDRQNARLRSRVSPLL